MKKRTLNIFLALIFFAATLIGFYTIWRNSTAAVSSEPETYTPLEISGVKEEASTLIQGRENNANLPLTTPTAKMGKTNPFNNPE